MNIKELIARNLQNKGIKYFTRPSFYFLLKILTAFWRPQKGRWPQKISLSFYLDLLHRAYRKKQPVVWTNVYTPPELIWALGGIPFMPEIFAAVAASLGLAPFFLKKAGEAWYSTDLCSFHRGALGMMHSRLVPPPDLVLATSQLCDGAVKFLEAASAFYQCPFYLLHIPYPVTSPAKAQTWLAEELTALARDLKPLLLVMPQTINKVANHSNQAREHLLAVNQLRQQIPSPYRGSEALSDVTMHLLALGTTYGTAFYRHLEDNLSERVKNKRPVLPQQKYRLLWLHFRPYYPNFLFDFLEKHHGAAVAFEEVNAVTWEKLSVDDFWFSLAAKILANPLWGPAERRVVQAVSLARLYQVHGVIHFAQGGCRQSNGSVFLLRETLRRHKIPFLNLEGDCIDERNFMAGQTMTRLESFLELLEG
jgi:benzoyl-CoA reductase/2-hydroxyglutaryl-CoA dehydratase subunit BcrC/BadD/HgdB